MWPAAAFSPRMQTVLIFKVDRKTSKMKARNRSGLAASLLGLTVIDLASCATKNTLVSYNPGMNARCSRSGSTAW
jgi:hypothetical protein